MVFRITKKSIPLGTDIKADILYKARQKVFLYFTSTNELALEEYLKKQYKVGLKAMCITLLNYCCINPDYLSNEITITFKTKWADDVASLITYGNSEVQGSNILKFALS